MAGFTVAIVGRPNVGKSTLFNRLLEERKAIVDDYSGVTRDRQYGLANWNGRSFNVIDTGGFVDESKDMFEQEIAKQVHIAMNEADLLLFVVDVITGITTQDQEMTDVLRKGKTPVLLVVNKVDNGTRSLEAAEFYGLGFEHQFEVSSISGGGTGDLLDEVTKRLEAKLGKATEVELKSVEDEIDEALDSADWDAEGEEAAAELADEEDGFDIDIDNIDEEEEMRQSRRLQGDAGLPKFAIIGQPNAGKSTLLNALIGEERTIVSPIPGTTRDTIHTHYKLFGQEFVLIDTAGIRKKKNVHEDLEFYSVIRAIRAMDEADVCLLLIDAEVGITSQDVSIFSLAARKGKGVVILVNKWDVMPKETNTARDFEKALKFKLQPFTDVPVLFVSAKEKQRIFQAIEKALAVVENRRRRVLTRVLNAEILPEINRYPPPMMRGHSVKIKYAVQLPVAVPSFAFFANHPDAIKTPYRNFLENKLRAHFEFEGTPVRVFFRKK